MAVGDPIRSKDFQREKQAAQRAYEMTQQTLERTAQRTHQAELATQAVEKHGPPDVVPASGNGPYVYTRRTEPGASAEQIGTVTVQQRSDYAFSLQAEDVLAEENDSLLRPGEIWAKTAPTRTARFEVRLDPPRLIRYNELHVPHIAGRIDLLLFSPQGRARIRGIEESRVFRYEGTQLFNGRLVVESTSRRTTATGQYIHTLGGLSFLRSSWVTTGEVTAGFTIPYQGFLTDVSVRLLPSGEEPSFDLYANGTKLDKEGGVYSEQTGSDVLSHDQLVEVKCKGVRMPASFLEVTFTCI